MAHAAAQALVDIVPHAFPTAAETAFGEGADEDFRREVAESTPMRRWGTPEDVAATAVWLASPGSAFLTGQAVNVNGGTVM